MRVKKDAQLEVLKKVANAKINTKEKVHRTMKKLSPQQTSTGNPQYQLEKRLQAKALYLSSGGAETDTRIGEILDVSLLTVGKWRTQDGWARELPGYQRELKQHILDKIKTEGVGKYKRDIKKASDDQLLEIVKTLVGPTVSKVVASFLAQRHRTDLLDLDRWDRAVRKKLGQFERNEITLCPKDIFSLVGSKINIIKGSRLILGMPTEITEGREEDNSITVSLPPEVAASLQRALDQSSIEAEFKVIELKGEVSEPVQSITEDDSSTKVN